MGTGNLIRTSECAGTILSPAASRWRAATLLHCQPCRASLDPAAAGILYLLRGVHLLACSRILGMAITPKSPMHGRRNVLDGLGRRQHVLRIYRCNASVGSGLQTRRRQEAAMGSHRCIVLGLSYRPCRLPAHILPLQNLQRLRSDLVGDPAMDLHGSRAGRRYHVCLRRTSTACPRTYCP